MKAILAVMAALLVLCSVPSASADGYCRNRTVVYATSYRQTYTPTYTAPAYVTPTYEAPVYLKAVKAFVSPDYYSSVADYYRDQLLVNAVAGKTLELIKGQQELTSLKEEVQSLRRQLLFQQQPLPPETPRQTAPPAQAMPRATSNLPVPEGLQAIVTASCVRCHGATAATTGAGIDLQNLATVPREVRLAAKAAVDDGSMPRGGKALSDQAAALFHEWSTGRKGTLTSSK